jgi:hypothetical protein
MEIGGQFHASAALPSRNDPGEPQGRSGFRGVNKNLLTLPEIELRLSSP